MSMVGRLLSAYSGTGIRENKVLAAFQPRFTTKLNALCPHEDRRKGWLAIYTRVEGRIYVVEEKDQRSPPQCKRCHSWEVNPMM